MANEPFEGLAFIPNLIKKTYGDEANPENGLLKRFVSKNHGSGTVTGDAAS